MRRMLLLSAILMVTAAACDRRVPAPPRRSIRSIETSAILTGDAAQGARFYREKQCAACHGPAALGGIGGRLAGTTLPFDAFLSKIRNALPPKPALDENDLPEAEAYSIYLWLQGTGAESARVPAGRAPALPAGQILGIQLWADRGCGKCHGAFAQGSAAGPALTGVNFPFERERAVMRQYAGHNPAHSEKNIPDDVLQRILDWLRRGADPASGC